MAGDTRLEVEIEPSVVLAEAPRNEQENHQPETKLEPQEDAAQKKSSFRGPLRYEIDTSMPQLEAGRKFSIFVRITNPYDVPVRIARVQSSLPAEFYEKQRTMGFWQRFKKQVMSEALKPSITGQELSEAKPSVTEIEPRTIVLQPGNTTLKRFTVQTWQRNLFPPGTYTLHFQCEYEMEGLSNFDAMKQQFTVRAPMSAVMWGSAWGALTGSLLQAIYANQLTWASGSVPVVAKTVFSGLLLAAVLVIGFARKKDVQPFISIEDFWGGFFVGFVAGYVGKPLLNNILPK